MEEVKALKKALANKIFHAMDRDIVAMTREYVESLAILEKAYPEKAEPQAAPDNDKIVVALTRNEWGAVISRLLPSQWVTSCEKKAREAIYSACQLGNFEPKRKD